VSDRVLITGASSGIGKETALLYASEGASLFLVARREERLSEVADLCRKAGSPQVSIHTQDLSVPGAGRKIVEQCLRSLGGLDILICNAGYGVVGPVSEVTPEEMERVWRVNFQAGYESIHAAIPHFLAQKHGRIVLVSSIVGKKAMPYMGPYCATKFAQVGLGESLWGELSHRGIGVSVICPSYTATEFSTASYKTKGVRSENPTRPVKGQSPKVVARALVQAVKRNRREVHLTVSGKLLLFIDRFSRSLSTWIMATHGRKEREPS